MDEKPCDIGPKFIERYWGHLKATATNNYFLGSVEELECAIIFAVRDFNRSRSQRMLCNLELMRPLRKTAWMTETACLELFCRGFSIRCVAHTQTRIRERREHDSFFVAD